MRMALAMLLGIFLIVPVMAASVSAQVCCGSAQSDSAGRLAAGQSYLLAGSFSVERHFARFEGSAPAALTGESMELRQGLMASARLGDPFQATAIFPFIQTYKSFGEIDEWGGGMGDLTMVLRYELIPTGLYQSIPGLGVFVAGSAPTGRNAEESRRRGQSVLQTDVTTTGAWKIRSGVWADHVRGRLFGGTEISLELPFPHEDQDRNLRQGPQFQGAIFLGRALKVSALADGFLYTSARISKSIRAPLKEEGIVVGNLERLTTASIELGGFAHHSTYLGIRGAVDVPIRLLGEDMLAGWSMGLSTRRSFDAY